MTNFIKLIIILIITSIFIICNFSCQSEITNNIEIDEDIEYVLNDAGKNKANLEKLLRYYSKKDSLKFEAALYLIRNMKDSYLLDTNSISVNTKYFDLLQEKNKDSESKISVDLVYKTIDDYIIDNGILPEYPVSNKIKDCQILSFSFLKDNIEKAIFVWKNFNWCKNLSFEDFCEYILPYSCDFRYYHNSRQYFIDKYMHVVDSLNNPTNYNNIANFIIKDIDNWFTEDLTIFSNKYPYLQPISFENLIKGKIGGCNDINTVKVLALRSLGIPVVFDWLPNWGNSNSSHFWFKTIQDLNLNKDQLLSNENKRENTQNIITGSSYDDYQDNQKFKSNVEIYFKRTVPKVYRNSFSKDKNNIFYLNENKEEIPEIFNNAYIMDVTKDYINVIDVTIEPFKNVNIYDLKFAYLLCFNNEKWTPVAWGNIVNNKVMFKDIGKNVVYLPAIFSNNKFIPIDYPFLIQSNNYRKIYNPIKASLEEVKITSKFPYRSHLRIWSSFMVGTKFVLSNSMDFSDSTIIHKINYIPYYRENINLNLNLKVFRYFLYNFSEAKYPLGITKRSDVGDIQIWGIDENENYKLFRGKAFGNDGNYLHENNKGFDNNKLTYFEMNYSPNQNKFIGLDFGENFKGIIKDIIFYPRNDDNSINHDENYELFIWNNSWDKISNFLGKDLLKNLELPKNGLFLLKNNGRENRIFEIVNSKQIFR